MDTQQLIEKAKEKAETHILKKGSSNIELPSGDNIFCCIESASSRHSGGSWGKVCFYVIKKGEKRYTRFSKEKCIIAIG